MGGVSLNSLQKFDRIVSVLYFGLNLCYMVDCRKFFLSFSKTNPCDF